MHKLTLNQMNEHKFKFLMNISNTTGHAIIYLGITISGHCPNILYAL